MYWKDGYRLMSMLIHAVVTSGPASSQHAHLRQWRLLAILTLEPSFFLCEGTMLKARVSWPSHIIQWQETKLTDNPRRFNVGIIPAGDIIDRNTRENKAKNGKRFKRCGNDRHTNQKQRNLY
jgi:hypothetical protein